MDAGGRKRLEPVFEGTEITECMYLRVLCGLRGKITVMGSNLTKAATQNNPGIGE